MAGDIKKQLIEISDAVNSFKSDAVQVIVVERVLDELMERRRKTGSPGNADGKARSISRQIDTKKDDREQKQPGATRLLRGLLNSDYFETPRSIGDVTDHFNAIYTGPFYTYQLSGLLLTLLKSGKLKREIDAQTNRFVYLLT